MSQQNDPHHSQPVLHAGLPLDKAQGVMLLLHGRGASAEDILGLAGAFRHPRLAYLSPQAATHSWYPNSFLAPREQNEPWLTSALRKVEITLDEARAAGVPPDRVVLCGFSQGACVATEFVATHPARYAGLIAYTGGLIGPPGSDLRHAGDLAGMPALLASGDPDPHVPWLRVEESAQVLRAMGAEVTTRRYPGRPHTVSSEEIDLGQELIHAAFP
ncbi:MAG TPA: dienelactone hydrolase family protein [Acidobacteriaceae bacterium]